MFHTVRIFGVAAILAGTIVTNAAAQDTITLRMGTSLPANNYGVTEAGKVFISEVEKLSGGKLKIEFYPSEQAGKAREALELVRTGAIDIYELGTGYYSGSDVPLWGLLEAPNVVKSVCDGSRAMRTLGEPGNILWQTQYEPLGIRVLANFVYPGYGPSASIKPVNKVEDLVGLKMRNAGGLMERTTVALGAVPVALTGPEILQALQRGTIDSWMGAYSSVKSYQYYPYGKYGATGFSIGTPGMFPTISEAKFQSLPKELQDVLVQAGKIAEEHFCAYTDKEEADSIVQLQTPEYGMTIHTWTPEEVTQLEEKTANVVPEWVANLESRGLPAGEAMKAFLAALPSN